MKLGRAGLNKVSSGVQAWAFLEAIGSSVCCLYDWAVALKPASILYAIDPKFVPLELLVDS